MTHKSVISFFVVLLAPLALLTCKSAQPTSSVSENDKIYAEGASNTRGVCATTTFDSRIKFYLHENKIDLDKSLGGKSIAVSIDYFFPTNFPALVDDGITAAAVTEETKTAIKALRAQYDYVLIANLYEYTRLDPETAQLFDKTPYKAWYNLSTFGYIDVNGLKTIAKELSKTPDMIARVHAINTALDEMAKVDPNIKIAKIEELFRDMLPNAGYKDKDYDVISASSMFYADNIHLNDAGQAAVYNLAFKKLLESIPELKDVSPLPEMTVKAMYSEEWRQKLLKYSFADGNLFKEGKDGLYFGLISNPLKLITETYPTGAFAKNTNDISAVKSRIASAKYPGLQEGGGHAVKIETLPNGKKKITLDQFKTIMFNFIDLEDVGDGTYTGYGYDYFYYASGSPSTNYKYVARFDPRDKSVLNVDWYIFPMVATKTETQAARLVALKNLEPKWIKEIEASLNAKESKYPYLKYEYQLKFGN